MNRMSIKELCRLEPSPEYAKFLRIGADWTGPVIIYGAGYMGREIYQLCQRNRIPVAAVCDSKLAGRVDEQFGTVRSFQEAIAGLDEYQVIIASVTYRDEIERSIRGIAPGCRISYDTFPLLTMMGSPAPEEYRRFLEGHAAELEALAGRLEDGKSRDTLFAVLKARLTWDLRDLQALAEGDQYFPAGVVALSQDEVFYDCGAWTGDTLGQMLRHTGGRLKQAVCFEPSERAGQELARTFTAEIREGKVRVVPNCLSDQVEELYFRLNVDTTGSHIVQDPQENDMLVQSTTIDAIAGQGPDVTFIKMDIEGAELAALRGARETILRCRPKLAICVYHKIEDLVQIPQYIDSLRMGYRFFLRHHTNSLCETVLYAV